MPDFDPSAPASYNSMQQQMGLLPQPLQPPPVIFPGQVSAALSQGGPAATAFITPGSAGTSFGAGYFPGQMLQGFTDQSPMYRGPTGIMMPMQPGAAFATYPQMNPYAGLGAYGPYQGAPGLFTPMAAAPPPAYAGQMGARPFMPPPPMAHFNTAYAADLQRQQMVSDANYTQALGFGGIGARLGLGMLGAGIGGRFGGVIGAGLGGLAGTALSEYTGAGQFSQNLFMNNLAAPLLHQRAMAGGIEELSQGFVNSGLSLHARGRGFTHHAAADVAAQIREMSSTARFQHETSNRFNQQDLFQIAQTGARSDMMTGVQNPQQMVSRVRELAKSLSVFMELAQEPDIQRAIGTMSQLRSSGLTLTETTRAVAQGRQFARMAGTTFGDIMDVGGALGSQTFQAMGLSQGSGVVTGIQNYALARSSQLGGTLSPQLMSLLGGPTGLANLNNLASGSLIQRPMMAPSIMSANAGVNLQALQGLISGRTDFFSQTQAGAGNLQAITGQMGTGGLGLAIAMQPTIQDTIARVLQSRGPFAQRNFEDRTILNTMRQLNQSGAQGFALTAQALGYAPAQAEARIHELSDPRYFARQSAQIEATRQESRRAELDRYEDERPGVIDEMSRLFRPIAAIRRAGQATSVAMSHLGHFGQERAGTALAYVPENVELQRELEETRSRDLRSYARQVEAAGRSTRARFTDRYRTEQALATMRTGRLGFATMFESLDRALDPRRDASREAGVAQARQIGLFAQNLLNADRDDIMSAQQANPDIFGPDEGRGQRMAQFAQSANQILYGTAGRGGEAGSLLTNTAFRGGVSFAAAAGLARLGPVGFAASLLLPTDPGNIAGLRGGSMRQLEDAYVQSMRSSGVSEAQLRRNFQSNPTGIANSVAAMSRVLATGEVRSRLRDVAATGQTVGGLQSTGFSEGLAAMERTATRSLFGENFSGSAGNRSAANDIYERVSSTGNFGRDAQEQTASRNYRYALAMYQSVAGDPTATPEQKRQAAEKARQVVGEIQQRFGQDRATDILESLTRSSVFEDIRDNSMQQAAARAFVGQTSGMNISDVISGIENYRNVTNQNEVLNRVKGGVSALARGGGVLGNVFTGIQDEQFSISRLQDRVAGMTEQQLRQLEQSQNPQHREIARAARMMKNSATADEGFTALQSTLTASERTARYRREFQSMGLIARGFMTEDEYVRTRDQQNTGADAVAARQEADINDLRTQTSGEFGGRNNPLLRASTELREAARALQGAVAGRGLENMME